LHTPNHDRYCLLIDRFCSRSAASSVRVVQHFAAYYQRVHCASILCKHGFNKRQLELRTDQNKTAVEIAFNADCQDIISLLRDEPVQGLTPTVEDLEELAFQEVLALDEKDSDPSLLLETDDIPDLPDVPIDDDEALLDELALPPLPTPPSSAPPPAASLPPTGGSPVLPTAAGSRASVGPFTRATSMSSPPIRATPTPPPPTAPLPAPLDPTAVNTNRNLLYEMRQSSGSLLVPLPTPIVGGAPPIPTRPSMRTSGSGSSSDLIGSGGGPPSLPPRE
jgi:hypothetical protein